MIAYPPVSMSERTINMATTPHARSGSQTDDRKERVLAMSPSNKGPVQFAAMPPNSTPSHGSFKDGPAVPSTPASAPAPAEAPPLSVISYLTPKNILLKVIKAGIAKAKMTWWKSLLMAFMAGMYIGLGSLLMITIMGGSPGLTTPIPNGTAPPVANPYVGIQKLLGGCVFPVGLLLLVILGGELVTGNVMYVGSAMLARKVTVLEYAKNLGIVYFGNFLGSLFMAYFLAYLPEMLHTAPYVGYLQAATVKKINAGWGVNFLRGIGCNWMVCAALFFALGSDEMIGKIVALWWPIMAFIALGYEHCVANMFILPLGLMEGADSNVGWFLAKNLIPVSLGNWVGGFVFLAVVEWVVFSEFFGEKLTALDTRPGHKPEKGVKVHTLVAHPSNHPASPHFHWPNIHMPHLPGWMHMPHFFHNSPAHGEGAAVKEEESQSAQSNRNNEPALENNPQPQPQPQPPLNGDFDVEMGRTNIV